MKNIAVFASGNGTNLQAIIDHIRAGELEARLALVVSDKKDAFALKRAKRAGIKTLYIDPKEFPSKKDYEKYLVRYLRKEKIVLVVLAGFMRILSPYFVAAFKNRILNIHPALLPAFPGASAIKDAYDRGVRVTGVTVHFVDEKVDHGPIIAQESLLVARRETIRTLEEKIHKIEHRIYPEVIGRVLGGLRGARRRGILSKKKGLRQST